ncbi:MAG: ribosome silencing factor [Caldisericaceae bacterium]|nr:ribosome silencing factor [Caldisericaceae bacterium]
MTSDDLVKKIADLALDKKAKQIAILNLKEITDYTDFFIIMTGESSLQIKAISDHIEDELAKQGIKPYSKEGYEYLRWVLLDFVDVVVHIFNPEAREFYGIERLYADAKMELVTEEEV